jgi:tetratricopeptide (TPR) repeat protein
MLMWEASLLMVKESPVLGKGIGNYRLYYPKYQGQLLNDPKNKAYDYVVTWMPHQNYLLIAAETGLAGLGLFLLAVFMFYNRCYDIFIRKKTFEPAAVGLFAAVTAVLAASFFNTFYNVAATTLYFFIMLFVIAGYGREAGAYVTGRNNAGIAAVLSAFVLLLFIVADGKTISSNIMLKKANKAARDRNYSAAISYYERIIRLNPVELCPQTDVAQYYYAAESYRESGNLQKALEYYEKDLKLNPYCPEVNNMLGALLGQLGDVEKAIKHLELTVFVAPHYDAAYINLATAYMVRKDYENARRVLEKYQAENGQDARFTEMLNSVGLAEKGTGKDLTRGAKDKK